MNLWRVWGLVVTVTCLLLLISMFDAQAQPPDVPPYPQSVNIEMYELFDDGASNGIACYPGNTNFGCTAFCTNNASQCEQSITRQYPYNYDTISVEVEGYYLLNVVSHEMDPRLWGEAIALEAQAITSRSYLGWHLNNTPYLINNSSGYQVFIPFRFDSLNPVHEPFEPNTQYPCFDISINYYQTKSCDSIYHKFYIARSDVNLPAFAEFTGDTIDETLTYPSPNTFPYIKGVPDPISDDAYGASNLGNRRGLSSRGANRWSLGNQYSRLEEGNHRWNIKWENSQQILFHYFTDVHLRDDYGARISPSYRWNPLSVQWEGTCPPIMIPGYVCTATYLIQNSGTTIWNNGTIGLIYHAGTSLYDPEGLWTSYPVIISQTVYPGETVLITVPYTLPNNAVYGLPYYFKFEMAYWDNNFERWVGFSESEADFSWPTYNTSVCVGDCKIRAPLIMK